ncbi:MAG: hypothetical protein J6U23_04230 [Clostridiales bacterium]|nr:hypothetical protein [Clostridiales bacterium]
MRFKRIPVLLLAGSLCLGMISGCDKKPEEEADNDNEETTITVEIPVIEKEEEESAESEEASSSEFYFEDWEDDYVFFKEAAKTLCSDKDRQVMLGYAMAPDLNYNYVLIAYDTVDGLKAYKNNCGYLAEYDLDNIEIYRDCLLTMELFEDYPALTDFSYIFCLDGGQIDTAAYLNPLPDGVYYSGIYAMSADRKYIYATVSNVMGFGMYLDEFENIKVGDTYAFDALNKYKILDITDDKIKLENGFMTYEIIDDVWVDITMYTSPDQYDEFSKFVKIPVSDDLVCNVKILEGYESENYSVEEGLTLDQAMALDIVKEDGAIQTFETGGYGMYIWTEPLVIENGEAVSADFVVYEDRS